MRTEGDGEVRQRACWQRSSRAHPRRADGGMDEDDRTTAGCLLLDGTRRALHVRRGARLESWTFECRSRGGALLGSRRRTSRPSGSGDLGSDHRLARRGIVSNIPSLWLASDRPPRHSKGLVHHRRHISFSRWSVDLPSTWPVPPYETSCSFLHRHFSLCGSLQMPPQRCTPWIADILSRIGVALTLSYRPPRSL